MHEWPPEHLQFLYSRFGWDGLIGLQLVAILSLLLLLTYRREASRQRWFANGASIAFFVALITEMYGLPLFILLLSPLLDIPAIGWPYMQRFGHWPVTLGMILCLFGLVLVVAGWRGVYFAKGLNTSGAYRYIRHPQYVGILLFSLGWIIHYPTIAALICWPIMVIAYVRLSLLEERSLLLEFGNLYQDYCLSTPRFFPTFLPPRRHSGRS